jgi:hypothetical protein
MQFNLYLLVLYVCNTVWYYQYVSHQHQVTSLQLVSSLAKLYTQIKYSCFFLEVSQHFVVSKVTRRPCLNRFQFSFTTLIGPRVPTLTFKSYSPNCKIVQISCNVLYKNIFITLYIVLRRWGLLSGENTR